LNPFLHFQQGSTGRKLSRGMECMQVIRVLFGDVAEEVSDWVRECVRGVPDIQLVGEARGVFQILLRAGESFADVVVVMLPENGVEPGIVSHLLWEYPLILILAVERSLTRVALFRQAITREYISGAVPEEIWSLIRAAAAQER